MKDLIIEAEGRDCDIAMFGHTHRPVIYRGKRVIAINPGSISYPRQEGKQPSYIIMTVEDGKDAKFTIKYL